jgi:tetratricopeptide (TPR) repeat protein
MKSFLRVISASLILGLTFQGTALAQSSGDRTFGSESIAFAKEAQALQGGGEHKKAIKRLKKGLKVDGLSAYETSTLYQMMGASYYARDKKPETIEAFENAIQAGGLSRKDKIDLGANIAQLNIAEENYAVGAQQLETYFREGGARQAGLVRMLIRAYMRSENRAAAVPWAEVMLQQGFLTSRRDHELAIYLFDSAEKRASQMRVAKKLYAKWPSDPKVLARIERLNVKAKLDGVPQIAMAGQ